MIITQPARRDLRVSYECYLTKSAKQNKKARPETQKKICAFCVLLCSFCVPLPLTHRLILEQMGNEQFHLVLAPERTQVASPKFCRRQVEASHNLS